MNTAVFRPVVVLRARTAGLAFVHSHERFALLFFCFVTLLGFVRPLAAGQRLFLVGASLSLPLLCLLESRTSRPWTRAIRQWGSLALILAGYWSVGFFVAPPSAEWESRLISWDRFLLSSLGLRRAIEAAGAAGPFLLETLYLLLYAFPTIAFGIVTREQSPAISRKFLRVLFLGTFTAYALLPFFPVLSPRLIFPGEDGPAYGGFTRSVNIWLLDHYDTSNSVFPSGHVAVAFSCAFGLMAAVPWRRSICATALVAAALIYLATIYGRYHYAVDGLASIVIAGFAWRVCKALPLAE